jgi:hypothetical protein
MVDYWFKPKSHGYGAEPANWKGWLATAVYVIAATGCSLLWFIPQVATGVSTWLIWAVGMVALALLFILVVKRKMDGVFRWRWGSGGP